MDITTVKATGPSEITGIFLIVTIVVKIAMQVFTAVSLLFL